MTIHSDSQQLLVAAMAVAVSILNLMIDGGGSSGVEAFLMPTTNKGVPSVLRKRNSASLSSVFMVLKAAQSGEYNLDLTPVPIPKTRNGRNIKPTKSKAAASSPPQLSEPEPATKRPPNQRTKPTERSSITIKKAQQERQTAPSSPSEAEKQSKAAPTASKQRTTRAVPTTATTNKTKVSSSNARSTPTTTTASPKKPAAPASSPRSRRDQDPPFNIAAKSPRSSPAGTKTPSAVAVPPLTKKPVTATANSWGIRLAAGAAGLVAIRANLAARDAKIQEAAAAAARVRASARKPNNLPAAAIIGGTALAGALYLGLGALTPASSPVPPPTAIQVEVIVPNDTPQAVVAAPKPETTKMKGAVVPVTKQPETTNPVATPPPTKKGADLSRYQGPAAGAALAYGLYYAYTNREDPDDQEDTKDENDTTKKNEEKEGNISTEAAVAAASAETTSSTSSEIEDTSDRTNEEKEDEDDDDDDDDAASDTNDEEDTNTIKPDGGM